jgi:hypothetical protein
VREISWESESDRRAGLLAGGVRNDVGGWGLEFRPISGGATPSKPEIVDEERPNPYNLKSRVDLRGNEAKQVPIISGFDGRMISGKTESDEKGQNWKGVRLGARVLRSSLIHFLFFLIILMESGHNWVDQIKTQTP